MTSRRAVGVLSAVLVVALAGCATSSNSAFRSSQRSLSRPATPTTTTPTAKSCSTQPGTEAATPLPPPGDMPAGSYMATIQARRYLKVGVDENTIGFAARDPQTGELHGFEIALVGEIARAIFGNPSKVKYISVVTANKVKVVEDGDVDLTASVVSRTCDRARHVAFSSEYFQTPQRVMVNARSDVQHLSDLSGDKICVTSGSTTSKLVLKIGAIPYPVETRTDCLVALQQGNVDAIATHETILRGLHLQDPLGTRILEEPLPGEQQYGVAIAKPHPEFVSFVNGVLEQLHADGTYDQLKKRWVDPLYLEPPQKPAVTAEGDSQ